MADELDDIFAADARRYRRESSDHRCIAAGCPARATIFDSTAGPPRRGRCRHHDRQASRLWPIVTAALCRANLDVSASVRAELERVGIAYIDADARTVSINRPPGSLAEVAAYCQATVAAIQSRPVPDMRAWARNLRQRELAGEPLLPAQRAAWREAVGSKDPEAEREARLEREAMQAGL